MERNINTFTADVIRDEVGVYVSGCSQQISCKVQYVGPERIATDIADTNCTITAQIGQILPLAGSAVPNVLTVKVKDAARGYIWIEKTSYDSGFPECNDCCVALPTLDAPESFGATNGNTLSVTSWDDMPNATNYILEMATDGSFTDAAQIYSGLVTGYTKTGLTNGTTYYFRVKSQASGYNDSEWAFTTATPAP